MPATPKANRLLCLATIKLPVTLKEATIWVSPIHSRSQALSPRQTEGWRFVALRMWQADFLEFVCSSSHRISFLLTLINREAFILLSRLFFLPWSIIYDQDRRK